jgi:hypothetical protein
MIQETPNFLFENQYLYPVETSNMAKKAVSFSCRSISINPRCVNGGGSVSNFLVVDAVVRKWKII